MRGEDLSGLIAPGEEEFLSVTQIRHGEFAVVKEVSLQWNQMEVGMCSLKRLSCSCDLEIQSVFVSCQTTEGVVLRNTRIKEVNCLWLRIRALMFDKG